MKFLSAVKYLGITIDKRLPFKKHVKTRGQMTSRRLQTLCPILKPEINFGRFDRLRVFKAKEVPIAFYRKDNVITGPKVTKRKLFSKQTTLLRTCLGLP